MGKGYAVGETSASNSSMEKAMKSIAKFVFAATAIAACAAATAQPYGQSDQERRERNREEAIAKYGEPMNADRSMESHTTAREKTHRVAETTREKTHHVAESTRNFTHRQAQKMRNFGERQDERFGKVPAPAPEKTGQ